MATDQTLLIGAAATKPNTTQQKTQWQEQTDDVRADAGLCEQRRHLQLIDAFALSLPTVGVDVDQQVFGSAGWGETGRASSLCGWATSALSARAPEWSLTGDCELLPDAADPQVTQGLVWTGEGDLSAPPAVALTPLHIQD